MPLPEAIPAAPMTAKESAAPSISMPVPPVLDSVPPVVEQDIVLPDPEPPQSVKPVAISLQIPVQEPTSSGDLLSEEELDALLSEPIEPSYQELQREAPPVVTPSKPSPPPPPPPVATPSTSSFFSDADTGDADWPLHVEVGTKSDLDEDLGPGKWVESGRSPEELVRELDNMPVVERDFNLDVKDSVWPKVLLGLIVLVAVFFGGQLFLGGDESDAEDVGLIAPAAQDLPPENVEVIGSDEVVSTITTNLDKARVSLDGIEQGRAPVKITVPKDDEIHKICVDFGTVGRCIEVTAEELASREPYQISVTRGE